VHHSASIREATLNAAVIAQKHEQVCKPHVTCVSSNLTIKQHRISTAFNSESTKIGVTDRPTYRQRPISQNYAFLLMQCIEEYVNGPMIILFDVIQHNFNVNRLRAENYFYIFVTSDLDR